MNFMYVDVTSDQIAKAIKIRAIRDEQYGNIYHEVDGDLRWVGDLGEICFNKWLKEKGLTGFEWHLDNAARKPDFTINGVRVDIKTVKRKVPPRGNYTAQITARHKYTPVDELFFFSYEFQIKRLWFLGGIKKKDFLNKADHFKAGDRVHSNYVIRKGHEIYNAPIEILLKPNDWINNLLKSKQVEQ